MKRIYFVALLFACACSSESTAPDYTLSSKYGGSLGMIAPSDAIIIVNVAAQSNDQGNAEASEQAYAPMLQFCPDVQREFEHSRIWNNTTHQWEIPRVGLNTRSDEEGAYLQGYTFGPTADGRWDVGNERNRYNITGVGKELGVFDAWEKLGSSATLYYFKYTVGGSSINDWQKSAGKLYPKMLRHWKQATASLAGKNIRVVLRFRTQGEADRLMPASEYRRKLDQLYADLAADGLETAETKFIEFGIPVTADTGTPYSSPHNAVKQAWAQDRPNERTYIDPAFVALEHDEIHWNLASQYYAGAVLIPNFAFGTTLTLPEAVSVPAPTLQFDPATDSVTVIPPTAKWKQREFYYQIDSSPARRLTTSWKFGVSRPVASGVVKVWSRAVPGRQQSSVATNTTTW